MPGPGFQTIRLTFDGKAGAAGQRDNLFGMDERVVDAAQQHIFEGDLLSRGERHGARRFKDRFNGPLARDGHDSFAHGVVRGVERDGETRTHRLFGEALDAGDDAAGRDGHAGSGQTDFVDQQADRIHEGVVVEEGLAHAHEDEVDAVAAKLDLMAAEDRDDLTGDLAGSEVALDAELCGETELAVDGAADLRGDADGGAAARWRVGVVVGVLGAVAIGHPDRLNSLVATGADEIALGAIDRAEGLKDGRKADVVALGRELLAQRGGQGRDGFEVGQPVAIEGLGQLAGAEFRLVEMRSSGAVSCS